MRRFVRKLLCLIIATIINVVPTINSVYAMDTNEEYLEDEQISLLAEEDSEYADCFDPCIAPAEFDNEEIVDFSLEEETLTRSISGDFTENFVDINVNSLSSSTTDFKQLLSESDFYVQGDLSNYYYVLEGSCTDGEFYYFGYIVKQVGNGTTSQVNSGIVCAIKNEDGAFQKISNSRWAESEMNHVNDLTYNSTTDEIIVACCDEFIYNKIYTIPTSQFASDSVLSDMNYKLVSCKVTSIDYNETRNAYVVGLSGSINGFAIMDNSFEITKTVGYNLLSSDEPIKDSDGNVVKQWVRQSCCADNLRVYSMCYYYDKNKSNSYITENKIRVFDWNGKYITTIRINVTNGTDARYESENIFMDDDSVIVGFNCAGSSLMYKYLDISSIMFHIQYCPDENIDNYINQFDNGNASSLIIRGVKTPLLKQRISVTGEEFLGWTAYRTEADMWFYQSPDGAESHWYKEGKQPEGYTKYIYDDKDEVKNTGYCGEHVLMCAQWANTDKFFISFHSSATPDTIPTQDVTYGVSTPLRTNTFTKSNRTFQGWNAYWSEKNKWYYKDTYSTAKGWYKEGEQPVGYKKYLYLDGQSVAGTAYAGGHIQMHTLWDEFYIQYNSNEAIIGNSNILVQKNAHFLKGDTNKISFFSGAKINGVSKTISGYCLYRKEIDMWYYKSADGATKVWCYWGEQPSGYTLYTKNKPTTGDAYLGATAYPGEHLVLYAKWN